MTVVFVKNKVQVGMGLKKHINKEGMKTQVDYPAAGNRGEEKLEDYCTSIQKLSQATEVVQSSSLSLLRLSWSRIIFLCFHSFLVFVICSGLSLLALHFHTKFFTP